MAGRLIPRALVAALGLTALTFGGARLGVNAATMGLLFLVSVLALSAWGGWAVGTASAVGASLAFNYFFLPPFGTFHIADPDNAVAFLALLFVSTFSARLMSVSRRRAADALARRQETETLFQLSLDLFANSARSTPSSLSAAAERTLSALGATHGALVLGPHGGSEIVPLGGQTPLRLDGETLAESERRGVPLWVRKEGVEPELYLPLEVGGRTRGVLVARAPQATLAVLAAAGRLLALAIERRTWLEEQARLETLRVSEAWKTALLRAVSHDLRSPLTAIRLEVEGLARRLASRTDGNEEGASLRALETEIERLARRIDNLLSLARLEAGQAQQNPEPVSAADLARSARESLGVILGKRAIVISIEPDCPDLRVDPALAFEVLANLLENAHRYSPPESVIEIRARRVGSEARVALEVLDRGPGLGPESEHAPRSAGGLGLLIVRSLTTLLGGTFALEPRPQGGTIARLEFPAAMYEDTEEAP